ncbi:acyl--CoA ligase [Sphingomonas sp. AAP5]|uniref:AMP-binding protein n=1 Tax=Sphingomonas sp. AAP5 TaxID=1523415 RepID=UPI001056E879|nr:AMP-binding protein [Sphingomonas sp. AAP5]QBM77807.1 acyl--CoA ligase [Sphingomonas sp. AAP5]
MGSVADRQQALRRALPVWEPQTLHGVLDAAAGATPDRPFVITDARSWTYAELADWSKRLAAGLVALGVTPGETVALVLANYPEFVAIKYAVSRIGAVCVPINILNRRDELRYLLDQSDSVLLVTMDRFRGVDYLAMLDEIAPRWETRGGGDGLPRLRNVVVLPTGEAPPRDGVPTLASLDANAAWVASAVAPDAVCDIIYTSGTTGPPKGVLLTHDMLMRTAYGSAYARAFEDGRRILFSLPMYHVFGYVEGLLAVPFVGGAIVPQLRFDAAATLDGIARHRASDALLIPAMSLAVLDAAETTAYDLSSWHAVLASGGRAPERVWQGLRETLRVREITTGYGMTETTASTTVTRPDDPVERLLTTNGRQRDVGIAGDPANGGRLVTYRVVDPATGEPLANGATGELVAKGYGVTPGYYKKAEATAAAFDAEGWFRTGDLGRIDDDGYIMLLGRTKESYRCGGEQVLPTEIEDVLTTHPDVAQAHVVPVPDERMGEVGVAFVVARPGVTLDPSALQHLIAGRLARYKVPRHVLLVEAAAIPTTASGRARKFLLSEHARQILELP